MEMIEIIEDSIREIVKKRNGEKSKVDDKEHINGFFYSETDFQISLIRELEKYYPETKVFYEYPNPKNNREKIDVVLEKNGKQFLIELKYAYDIYGAYDKYFYNIAADFKKDIFKITNIVDEEKYGYCIALVDKKEYINNISDILGIKIDSNSSHDIGQIKICEANKDIYDYQFIYHKVGNTNFHCFIVEISKKC